MKGKWLTAAAVASAALLTGIMLSATTAAAQEVTYYCVNGLTVPPPAPITASSETAGSITLYVDEEWAAHILHDAPSGVFYVGYYPPEEDWFWGTDSEGFEDGYSTNYASLGACQAAWAPAPPRVAVCKMLMRGDGVVGMFQNITLAQWNDKESQYFDAPAANWIEGMGLTCDNPVALGYKAAGYNVAGGGVPDPGHDPNGVRGSGFNNIYPYFIK